MDPYKVLGVQRNASEAEVKKAYRKLAAKHHPDKGGDEAEFKKIGEAYARITEPEKFAHEHQQRSRPGADPFGGFGFGGPGHGAFFPVRFTLKLTLEEHHSGCQRTINLPGIESFTLTIPAHHNVEQPYATIVTTRKGQQHYVIVTVELLPHRDFKVDGLNLECNRDISLIEYYEGTSVQVKTVEGKTYNVKVQPNQPNRIIRMPKKGLTISKNGLQQGDLFVHVRVKLPELTEAQLSQLKSIVQPNETELQ